LIAEIQAAADQDPTVWAGQAGPADRAVLDALCLISLRCGQPAVDASVRRLALLCGLGRSTVHRALARLTAAGWIALETPADGPHAARWRLHSPATNVLATNPGTTTNQQVNTGGTQGVPPPRGGTPVPPPGDLETQLAERLQVLAHDAFAYPAGTRLLLGGVSGGLGHHLARSYLALTQAPRPAMSDALSQVTGYTTATSRNHLRHLAAVGLARRTKRGWRTAGGPGQLDRVAKRLGSAGLADARARRYAAETERYAWWLEELAWMHAPKRPTAGQPLPQRPHRAGHTMPRTYRGRADLQAALALLDPTAAATNQAEAAALTALATTLGAQLVNPAAGHAA
jgi:IclR helix-turn-helix domain